MNQPPTDPPHERHLNPALKRQKDSSHNLDRNPAPLETTEAKEGEGERWPIVWAVVTLACIVIALYFIF